MLCIMFYRYLSLPLQFRLKWVPGLLISGLFFLSGICLFSGSRPQNDPSWFGHTIQEHNSYVLTIEEPLQHKPRSYKAVVSVNAIIRSDTIIAARGRILVYFPKDSAFLRLRYGDRLLSTAALQAIRSSGNPGSFDYAAYCSLQGIHFQSYINAEQITVIDSGYTHFWKTFLISSREKIVHKLKQLIPGKREQGLAEALLIGYKEDLDKDLLQSYSNTGVVHVIAISGLHLGLIYLLLSRACRLLPWKHKVVQGVLIIAGLWIFSGLAGASPSVLRSAVMFSFIVMGDWIKRRPPSVNSLAASAFLLLCIEPAWVWDPGFQLSYAAVLGLIVLSKPVYQILYLKNPLLDELWKMNAVTVAATLLTLPITFFYFQQFPVYFMITNILVVPLSSLILLAEILLLVLTPIPMLASIAGIVTGKLIELMNNFVEWSEQVPGALVTGIRIDLIEVLFSYSMLLLIVQALRVRRKKHLLFAALCFIVLLGYRQSLVYMASRQQRLIVYNSKDFSAADLITGRGVYAIAGQKPEERPDAYLFNIRPARVRYHIKSVQFNPLIPESITSFKMNEDTIIWFNSTSAQHYFSGKANILIISGNPKISAETVLLNAAPQLVILDATNSRKTVCQWRQALEKLPVKIHDMAIEGAFVKSY